MSFIETHQAIKSFQEGIACSECETSKKDLQFLGISCKHAFCWDCINKMTGDTKKSKAKTLCRRCAMELNLNKISGATILNNCHNLLGELQEYLEKYEKNKKTMTKESLACTQRMMENFDLNAGQKQRTVDEFLMTQAAFPDDASSTDDDGPRTSSLSPELDAFTEYTNPKLVKSVERPRRSSVKRQASPKENIAKRAMNFDLFSSQIPEKPSSLLTPFVNRRKTESAASSASNLGPVALFADPLKSSKKDDLFSKKVSQPRRTISSKMDESSENSTSSRFSTGRLRSESPASFDKISGNNRRSSFGTRRGEVVIINSILQNLLPQLRSAIEAGTCVNERDSGKTPLYIAVQQENLEAVKILVEAGAIINANCDVTFETVLHEAVRRKNYEIVDFLLSKGASIKAKNSWQKTPEDLISKDDLKMRKIFDRFRNKHMLQPVIPPRRPKISFVQLTDETMLTDIEKAKVPGKINLVSKEMDGVSHYVVRIDARTKVLRLTKDFLGPILKAIIRPGLVVSLEWIFACISNEKKVDDDRNYMVKKVRWMDGPIIEGSIQEWKKTDDRMTPKLFAGCKFFFLRAKYSFLDRVTLVDICRAGGGQVFSREPLVDKNDPPPFHNSNLAPIFVVYSLNHDVPEKYRDSTKFTLICDQWIIEAILAFSLAANPY
ncbi:unnamed protein product [Caenorhabditis angaria]|uniref:Uncharacterized protein n=1 Tax=Caenorhabditis angaria TaxID=860376 RepID=A0A9P1IGS8_9PELO|nr:unnamed protein product [Caenorhabditis angaria]